MQLEHHQIKNQKHDLNIIIVAENIKSPENIGMIFRNADAFGAKKVYLTGNSPQKLNKKVTKTSRSSVNFIDFEYIVNTSEIIKKYQSESYRILALEYSTESKALPDSVFSDKDKLVLIIGSESKGVEESTLKLCDEIIHINMYGRNSSINVANAAAITLYEITRTNIKRI